MNVDQSVSTVAALPTRVHSVVKRILRAWTGYQLGVNNQSAGWQTQEKDEWFGEVLRDYLLENHDAHYTDLAEWMENILDEEFNLILEDSSLEVTAGALLKCANWIRTNNEEKLSEFTATLPTDEQVQAVTAQSRGVDTSSSDESGDDDEEAMDAEDTAEVRVRQPRTVTDEDGWTTIMPRQQQ